ncbi:MAG TPA: hypothetical protein VHC41_04865 [Mycobacteriales bacterium]|nr:hypothetical protein [Mycobacteriales bacterium]
MTTSADDYPAGTAPKFTAVLSTTGPSCTAPAPVVFTVVSGSDRIWSNVDCAKSTSGPVTTLGDKGGASSVRSWQRDRSAPGCKKVYGSSTAAAGTYRVTASWAGVTSNEAVFRLH